MKKEKRILVLMILGLLMISFLVGVVSAAETSGFFQTPFYEAIKPYLVPDFEGSWFNPNFDELSALVIGIISLIMLAVVFWDVLTLVPVFSKNTIRIIAVGLIIIMIFFKWNVKLASWLFAWGAVLFGWAGSIAVIGVIVLGIVILIALFLGGGKVVGYLKSIRTTRENMEKIDKARGSGGDIAALSAKAEEATK